MFAKCNRQPAFTLFELLVTLAVTSLLLLVGLPSLGDFAARGRQTAEINALFHAVHLARKESIMRRRVVSLCGSADGRQCSGATDWSTGWLLFENSDRDSPPRVDAGEAILLRHQVHPAVQIRSNRQAYTSRATYLRATNGTLIACDRQQRIAPKALVVSYTGRPRVTATNGRGAPYSCAD